MWEGFFWGARAMELQEYTSIRAYLLGLSQENEQPPIEERLLTDDKFYEELLIAEDELIDEYLAGKLSAPDQKHFEEHFLITTERQQKLRFGRALKMYTADKGGVSVPSAHWWSPAKSFLSFANGFPALALGAGVLLLVLGVSWLAIKNSNPTPGSSGNIVTAVLIPGVSRADGETTRVSIPADTDTLQLKLRLAQGDYEKYNVEILGQGTKVWTGTDLRAEQLPEGKFLVLNLPANTFKRDDYQVKLSGQLANGSVEDLASYSFRVSR